MSSPFINDITLPTEDIKSFPTTNDALDYMRVAGSRVRVEGIDLTEQLLAQLRGVSAPTDNVYKNGIYIDTNKRFQILMALELADEKMREMWIESLWDKLDYISINMCNPEDIVDDDIRKDYQKLLADMRIKARDTVIKSKSPMLSEESKKYLDEKWKQWLGSIHILENRLIFKEQVEEKISQDEHAATTRDQIN